MSRRICAALAALLLCQGAPASAETGPGGRNNLWLVVSLKCMRHLAKSEAPIPCDAIDDSRGWDRGVAYLKAPVGRARMLVIPTHPVSGIEDPAALADDEPNYFAAAWRARNGFALRLRRPAPPPSAVAVTVDSKPARDADQLNLAVDCLKPEAAVALEAAAPRLDGAWRENAVTFDGPSYWARVARGKIEDLRPFRLLADDLPGAKADLADWSLALTAPAALGGGYLLLADKADGAKGGRAQDLLDPACALADK